MKIHFSRKSFLIFLACLLCYESGAQRIVCDETCTLADAAPAEAKSALTKASKSKTSDLADAQVSATLSVKKEEPGYSVVSPVGRSAVGMINQASRLETLEGKTIAVVGVSFMTSVTHPEIKRLILENYPSAKVILLDEIGIAGPYPAPGVVRKQKENFQKSTKDIYTRLKEER